MRFLTQTALVLVSLSLLEASLGAQTPTPAQRSVCLRGQALLKCRSHPVIEFGYARGMFGRSAGLAAAELGWMGNVAPQWGIGGTLLLASDSDWGSRVGLKVRARRYLKPPFSLEIGAGVYLGGDDPVAGGLTTHVALNIADLAALTTQVEAVPGTGTSPGHNWLWVGARVGSQGGAAVVLATLAYTILYGIAGGGRD